MHRSKTKSKEKHYLIGPSRTQDKKPMVICIETLKYVGHQGSIAPKNTSFRMKTLSLALWNSKIQYLMVKDCSIKGKRLPTIQTTKMRSRLSKTWTFRTICNWPLALKDSWKLTMNSVIPKPKTMSIMELMMGDRTMKMRRYASSAKVCSFALRFLKNQLSFLNLWITTKLRGGNTPTLIFHSTCFKLTISTLIKNISPSSKEFKFRKRKSDIQTQTIENGYLTKVKNSAAVPLMMTLLSVMTRWLLVKSHNLMITIWIKFSLVKSAV